MGRENITATALQRFLTVIRRKEFRCGTLIPDVEVKWDNFWRGVLFKGVMVSLGCSDPSINGYA